MPALDEVVQLYALESLSASGNSLYDISKLTALGGLTTLNLSGNNISNIQPLTQLTALRTLYLDNNPITDLTPLCSLTNLTSLSIKGISITESQLEMLSRQLPNCAYPQRSCAGRGAGYKLRRSDLQVRRHGA